MSDKPSVLLAAYYAGWDAAETGEERDDVPDYAKEELCLAWLAGYDECIDANDDRPGRNYT